MAPPHETLQFASLARYPWAAHGFIGRVAGIDVSADREDALRRLRTTHLQAVGSLALDPNRLRLAEQVHGAEVAQVGSMSPITPAPGADALITNEPGICLGIHVADCCAVFLLDPTRRALGLAHAGRKGTELGVLPATIQAMSHAFGSDPAALVVQLSPCIRPPLYEVDFAADLIAQARACGVRTIHDCSLCTGSDLSRWYSYRVERGRTGRMFALLAIHTTNPSPPSPNAAGGSAAG